MTTRMISELAKIVYKSVKPNTPIRVALSGGSDSVALLMACHELQSHGLMSYFDAIHINHKTDHSNNAQSFCQALCHKHTIDLTTVAIDKTVTSNHEAQWREARYRLLSESTPMMTEIWLGHHQNDQAETFILQALRGTGTNGLSGMKVKHIKNQRTFVRPFLDIANTAIKQYLISKHIEWVDDPSNKSREFKRNFIRHDVLPLLESKWPSATVTLARTASNLNTEDPLSRSVDQFRQWLLKANINLDKSHCTDLFMQLHHSPIDRSIKIPLADYFLYKHKKQISLVIKTMPFKPIKLSSQSDIMILNEWLTLETQKQQIGYGIGDQYINDITIRPRIGGETIQLSARQPHKKVKHLLQNMAIPLYLKEHMPLIYLGGKVVGIPGFALDDSICSSMQTIQLKTVVLEQTHQRSLIKYFDLEK